MDGDCGVGELGVFVVVESKKKSRLSGHTKYINITNANPLNWFGLRLGRHGCGF
jgi:hypothetical protein